MKLAFHCCCVGALLQACGPGRSCSLSCSSRSLVWPGRFAVCCQLSVARPLLFCHSLFIIVCHYSLLDRYIGELVAGAPGVAVLDGRLLHKKVRFMP